MQPAYVATVSDERSRCRRCHAQVYWAVTNSGKRMPLEIANLEPHWNKCVTEHDFRKRRKR